MWGAIWRVQHIAITVVPRSSTVVVFAPEQVTSCWPVGIFEGRFLLTPRKALIHKEGWCPGPTLLGSYNESYLTCCLYLRIDMLLICLLELTISKLA